MKTAFIPKLTISVFAMLALLIPAAGQIYAQGMGNQTKPTMGGGQSGPPQGQDTQQQPMQKPTGQGEEAIAANKVKDAKDGNSAVAAALEYAKAYPNGKARIFVVDSAADKIGSIADPAQRAMACEKLLPAFQGPNETDGLFMMLIEKKQYDDAFRLAAPRVQKVQGEVVILTQLALVGGNQIKAKNNKYQDVSFDYSKKAAEMIESGTKPAAMADTDWQIYKTKALPELYQTIGMISLTKNEDGQAQKMLQKSLSLDSNNALTYLLLGFVSDEEYQATVKKYQAASDDKEKKDLREKAVNLMSQTVDLFLHAAGLSEGNADLKSVNEQAKAALPQYYKFLHGGSDSGMQADIDKYKKAAVNP